MSRFRLSVEPIAINFLLALVLLVAGCIMTARYHAFAGVLILLMCAMVIWFGVLAVDSDT